LEANEDMLEYALAAEVSEAEALEPCTLAEAPTRSDWPLWEKAIQDELDTLGKASTWILDISKRSKHMYCLMWPHIPHIRHNASISGTQYVWHP
jgi:hypothetical protein